MDGSIATELEIGRVGASTALSFISSSDLLHSQRRLLHSQETASQLRIPTDFKQWQGFISSGWNHLTNDEQSPSFFNQDYLILDRMWHSHGCCLRDQAIASRNQKPSRNETRASFWSLNSQMQKKSVSWTYCDTKKRHPVQEAGRNSQRKREGKSPALRLCQHTRVGHCIRAAQETSVSNRRLKC